MASAFCPCSGRTGHTSGSLVKCFHFGGFDFWFQELPYHLEKDRWIWAAHWPQLSVSHQVSIQPWLLYQHKHKESHGVDERPTLLLLHGSHLSLMASNPSLDFTEPRIIPKVLDTQEARIPTGLSSIFLSHQSTNPPSGKLGVPGGPREQAHSGLPLQSLTQKVNSTCSRTAWKFRHTLRMTAIVTD